MKANDISVEQRYKHYQYELEKSSIKHRRYDSSYQINIFMGNRTITVYTSKDWWRDPRGNVKGYGVNSLVEHIHRENGCSVALTNEAKKIALSFIQKEYNQRSFIGKLFTKSSYNKAMKELQQ